MRTHLTASFGQLRLELENFDLLLELAFARRRHRRRYNLVLLVVLGSLHTHAKANQTLNTPHNHHNN
jgi:hypothetical protein